jgi:hypothetical protein
MTESVHAADGRRVLVIVARREGRLTHFAGEYVRTFAT